MTVEEAIRNYVDENDQYELYEGYSGRGMFGRKCLGVVVKQCCSFMDFIINLTRYMDDNDVEDAVIRRAGIIFSGRINSYIVGCK